MAVRLSICEIIIVTNVLFIHVLLTKHILKCYNDVNVWRQTQQTNEVDEVCKSLRGKPGFKGFIILNNDGIVIRYGPMTYEQAVQHASLALDLCGKSKATMKEIFVSTAIHIDTCVFSTIALSHYFSIHPNSFHPGYRNFTTRQPSENRVENVRLRTNNHELIIAQHGNYTLLVIQGGNN